MSQSNCCSFSHKKSYLRLVRNHRSDSLVPTSHLNDLLTYSKENNLLFQQQSGFIQGYWGIGRLISTTHGIYKAFI